MSLPGTDAARASASRPRRILWIAYVFPPVGGTQGLRMRRYLEEITQACPGTKIDVLTIKAPCTNPQFDPALASDLPDNVQVHRVKPGRLHRLRFRWRLDQRLAAGTNRMVSILCGGLIYLSNTTWIPPAVTWAYRNARSRYHSIYVFVDPLASLAVGHVAAILNPGARVVLEYGDPRGPARPGHGPLRKLAGRLEARALARCTAVIFRTSTAARAYQITYPYLPREKFSVVYGGVDWGAYDAIPREEASPEFRIVYTGTTYSDSADPLPFFEAITKIVSSGRNDIKVILAGVQDPVVHRTVADRGIGDVVSFLGHIPAGEVPVLQRRASVLLAFGFTGPFKISSKIAQYVAARVPILYLADSPDDPGADLVASSRRGVVVRNQPDAIQAAVLRLQAARAQGSLHREFDLTHTAQFSWHAVAGRVAALLIEG